MQVSQLIQGLNIDLRSGDRDRTIVELSDDSRQIESGWLFIARSGSTTDGTRYLNDAIDRGAAAVLTTPRISDLPADVTHLVCEQPGERVASLAARFFDHPTRRLKLIGVTGTNGKTTTAYMIRHLLNAIGQRCGMISTVEVDDGSANPRAAELTTPGAIELARLFRRMVDHGCGYCSMECSSHALHQGRLAGLNFDAAVFTNLSGDHLDYHGTMEAYAAAKAKLFESLSANATAIINGQDEWSPRMAIDCNAKVWHFAVDAASPRPHLSAEIIEATADGSSVRLTFLEQTLGPLPFPLVGRHNVDNLLGAVGAVATVTDRFTELKDGIGSMPPVPGRLERVTAVDDPFTVLVDYAHTDDALQNVLHALRPLVPAGGRLIVMFGCGGDRDRTKRPRMAQVACELADRIVITSDNPRTEEPMQIIDDILTGVPQAATDRVETQPDRAAAIADMIASAQPNDVLLLAGKGHEDYQILGTQKVPFDDRKEARAALTSRINTRSME